MDKPIKMQILLHLRKFIKKQDFAQFGCGELSYEEALYAYYFDKGLYRFAIGLTGKIYMARLVYIKESLLLTNNFKHCYVDRYGEDDFIIKKKDVGQIVLEEI